MNKEQKQILARIIISAVLLIVSLFGGEILKLVLLAAALIISGYDVIWGAVRGLFRGELLDEHFLMSIAAICAFGIGEYHEGVIVMMFYQVGELFCDCAVDMSRESVKKLLDIRAEFARVIREGQDILCEPSGVGVGEVIEIRPGERVPLDGIIESGNTSLDTASLTGESVPKDAGEGDEILGGFINLSGVIRCRVTRVFSDSASSRILNLIENSAESKSRRESFIHRFAKFYTPIVLILALLVAFIPPFFDAMYVRWISRALIFLVVSCPCALVISVPLTFYSAIGKASRRGILIKGGGVVETLAKIKSVALDKTGTITEGKFAVTEVFPVGISKEELINLAASCECKSTHPIAKSLLAASNGKFTEPSEVSEIAGRGISTKIGGVPVICGNALLMKERNIDFIPQNAGTVVYVASDGKFVGSIVIGDSLRSSSKAAISELKQLGISNLVMLTGDNEASAKSVADEAGVAYSASLLPEDKVNAVLKLRESAPPVCFVGDGMNDSPVIAVSDVGIAMGGIGSDASIEAADAVIMDDNLKKLPEAVRISRKAVSIAKENIVFSIAVKVLVMSLGAAGIATMWHAVFADVGVSILAILNAVRLLKK